MHTASMSDVYKKMRQNVHDHAHNFDCKSYFFHLEKRTVRPTAEEISKVLNRLVFNNRQHDTAGSGSIERLWVQ